jgi:protease-4
MRTRSFGLVGALLLASTLGSALLLGGCRGRPRAAEHDAVPLSSDGYLAIVNLREPISEETLGRGLFPLPASQTYVGLVQKLGKLAQDRRLAGLFVKLGPGIGFHRVEELVRLFGAFKAKKRPITCHAHGLDNAGAWLALAGCDEVWVSAAGDLETVGIGAELSYLKGAFDKLGVEADMLSMGRYKSGAEALTRTEPSPESRQNLADTLAHLRDVWLAGIGSGRPDPEATKSYVEDGPWTPERARDLGLVSHVGFEDEALSSAHKRAGVAKDETVFGDGRQEEGESPLAELVRLLATAGDKGSGRERVAVVPAVGAITMESSAAFGGDSGITAGSLTRTIRRLREDTAVRAIVLRLDSPGGSPLASDLIWRELMLTREQKPVIVSIGSMAASGGYYIASAGTKIVAPESAIVGSIGVFGGKIVVGGALERFGVTHHGVAASSALGAEARALYMSPMRAWDDPTRERVRASMQRIYDLFVARVAVGRDLPPEAVYQTAEGAIFLAKTGKDRGLIDELGGLSVALALAKKEAKLPDDIPIVIEGAAESLMEALLLGPDSASGDVEAAFIAFQQRQAAALFPGAEPAMAQVLVPFAAAVAPLLAGETVVTALPFSITVH